MLEIEIIKKNGVDVIDSKLLHNKLEVASYHADWIRRRIDGYGFEEGKDFYKLDISNMSNRKKHGGDRKSRQYLITLDMAKELAMLENNEIGQKVRRYFISAEKELRKQYAIREATKRARRTITDAIKESGENERMHGKGYSNFTRLVYYVTGLSEKKKEYGIKEGFRDTLLQDELKRVEIAEGLIKPLLDMGKEYSEIKETLKPLFIKKELL